MQRCQLPWRPEDLDQTLEKPLSQLREAFAYRAINIFSCMRQMEIIWPNSHLQGRMSVLRLSDEWFHIEYRYVIPTIRPSSWSTRNGNKIMLLVLFGFASAMSISISVHLGDLFCVYAWVYHFHMFIPCLWKYMLSPTARWTSGHGAIAQLDLGTPSNSLSHALSCSIYKKLRQDLMTLTN